MAGKMTRSDAVEKRASPTVKRTKPKWGNPQAIEDQHRSKREALFLTAARAFNEAGFHNTTLDDIAARLHVAKPTLYYYVKNKDDILLECHRLAFAHMQDAIEETKRSSQTGMEKAHTFLLAYMELVCNPFGQCIIRTGLQPLTPQSRAKLLPIARRINASLQEIIRQGVDDGSIRECDIKLTTNAILGCFNSVAFWYNEGGTLKPADITLKYMDLFLDGLSP